MKIIAILSIFLAGVFGSNDHRITDRDPINPGLKEVLLLGDSVMAGIGQSAQGKDYLARNHNYIFGAVGCQRLTTVGCTESSKLSSLEILKLNSGSFTKAVVVSTGYNDYNNSDLFLKNIRAICFEAKLQGVSVYWLTYREKGNVKKKSKIFNNVLEAESLINKNLHIVDWNSLSSQNKGWFSGDDIHLQGIGQLKMAQIISDAINATVTNLNFAQRHQR